MRHSPTLRVELQNFVANQYRNAWSICLKKANGPPLDMPSTNLKHQDTESFATGAAMPLFSVLSELAGSDPKVQMKVLLSRSEPQDATPYRQAFGSRLTFDAKETAVSFPSTFLDQPVLGANPARRKKLEGELQALWQADKFDMETQLRRSLKTGLLRGQFSAVEVAANLGITRWTLDRRLNEKGLHFQTMLNESRCDFTQQLLSNTLLAVAELATTLGYTDPSTLTRGFVRWMA